MSSLSGRRLQEAIIDYIDSYSDAELGLSKSTLKNKRNLLKRFRRFCGENPLTYNIIRRFSIHLTKKGLSPVSRKGHLKIIKAFVNFLHRRKYIKENFSRDIVVPKVPRRQIDIVPAETAEKIIIEGTKPGQYDTVLTRRSKRLQRLALRFALRTGLRVSELLKLKYSDINLEEVVITVQSKGGNFDVIPLPGDMIKPIKRLGEGKLFPVSHEVLNRAIKLGCKRLKIKTKLTCHTLRHIFCTTLLKQGVPLQLVSRLMRHSSVRITDAVYSHYCIDDLRYSLNAFHPLIKQGLSPEQVFDTVRQAVEKTGVTDDKRFGYRVLKEKKKLVITLTVLNSELL